MYALQLSDRVISCQSFSLHTDIEPFNLDYALRKREMGGGRIMVHKRPAFVALRAKYHPNKLTCCVSTNVVDLSDFGSRKKHGKRTAWQDGMYLCRGYDDPDWKFGRLWRYATSSSSLH